MIVFGIVFLLLVSIVSATILIDYYGKIVGTAKISPPIFYASVEEENITEGGGFVPDFPIFSIVPIDGIPHNYTITKSKLNINNPPLTSYDITLTYYLLPPIYPIYPTKNHVKFTSEYLDTDSFYSAKYTFYIKAKTNKDSVLNSKFYISSPVQTTCSYPSLSSIYPFCYSWTEETNICSVNMNIQQSNDYHIYEVSCNSNKLEFDKGSVLIWEVTPRPSSIWSYLGFSTDISVDGTTRIGVSA